MMNRNHVKGKKKGLAGTNAGKKSKGSKLVKNNKVKRLKTGADSTESDAGISCISALSIHDSYGLSTSISELVRREVANALMTGNFSKKPAQAVSPNDKLKLSLKDIDSEYVGLGVLRDMVNKLGDSVSKSDMKQFEESLKMISDRLLNLEEKIDQIDGRMTAAEDLLDGTQREDAPLKTQSKESALFPSNSKPCVSEAFKSGSSSRLYPCSVKPRREHFPGEDCSSASDKVNNEKTQVYDDLIRKYNQTTEKKENRLNNQMYTSKQIGMSPRKDWRTRLTEQHAFEAKMLMYKKSPYTLELTRHKDYVANKPRTPLRSAPTKPSVGYPALPRFVNEPQSDEPQSDWLFEQ